MTVLPQTALLGIPCRHGCPQAVGVYYLPRACPCFDDPVQALCQQHLVKLKNNGYPARVIMELPRDG